MAGQRFTIQFRESLWDAHSRKCLYCGKGLLFLEMEVDHVLPESLLEHPFELNALKEDMGLSTSFSLLGYENLAPSCRDCNGKKLDQPFPAGYGNIVLGKLTAKIPMIRAALDKKRQERDLDHTLRHIARSVEKGKFSQDELLKGLEFLRKHPNGIFGSSPNAPPVSPEERQEQLHFSGEISRLSLAPQVQIDMESLGDNKSDLNDLIYESVRSSEFNVRTMQGLSGKTFVVRADKNLRIVFTMTETRILVLSIHRKSTRF